MCKSVTIIGGGHQGLAMAAHLSLNQVDCYLWNRTKENIQAVLDTKQIVCKGIVDDVAKIKHVSTDVSECLQKVIMVTTPSSAHRNIAKLLAPYMDETYTVVLNPGRTFGALDFEKSLRIYGCKSMPVIAETQTIVYTCRRSSKNEVTILALKENIPLAALNKDNTQKVLEVLPECIAKNFVAAKSYVQTSMGNVGMILHCAPVLMNVGWIENEKVDFKYYYEGISFTVAKLLEKIDTERLSVAAAMGYPVESVSAWLERTYQTHGDNLFERLQNNVYYNSIDAPLSVNHRYLEEDVPNGLVPLESAGIAFGIATPYTTLIIDFANAVMERDYRSIGRNYNDYEQ